jgi:hypothetical protein
MLCLHTQMLLTSFGERSDLEKPKVFRGCPSSTRKRLCRILQSVCEADEGALHARDCEFKSEEAKRKKGFLMSEKKNSCPVCFTKMHTINGVLVCPECGYKLCDHSYQYHDSYSTAHTHTPDYTTISRPSQTSPADNHSSGKQVKPNTVAKIVRTVIIGYFVIILISILSNIFLPLIFSFIRFL